MDILNLMTRLKAGYYLADASALRQVKKAKIPVLFIHGENDTFVPYEMAVRLYEACGSDKKQKAVCCRGGRSCANRKTLKFYYTFYMVWVIMQLLYISYNFLHQNQY